MTEERPDVGPSAALRLIGHRTFGPYFVGNASSATGTWFQNLAASLFIYAGVVLAVPALAAAGTVYFLQHHHRSLTSRA